MSDQIIEVSQDPDINWQNNSIQFPRLIAELQANGAIDGTVLLNVADSMDLNPREVDELISRAAEVWDDIKYRTLNPD